MNDTTGAILATILAYLVGSIPFGFLIARFVKGIDIREHGSGNIGATNVGRVVGGKWGILALVLDAFKGALPVLLLPRLLQETRCVHTLVMCGVATIVGHMYPCFLKLRGGKGVATALGVVLVLDPGATLAAMATFTAVVGVTRLVALGSMLAASVFGITHIVLSQPDTFSNDEWSLGLFSIAVPLLIVLRHRSNIGRLLRGEEPKFRAAASDTPAEETPPDGPAE